MLQNLWQNMSLHLIDPTAITCCVNFGARCYKIYGKCKNFLMAVCMIFKYSKRFRYAPSFNNYSTCLNNRYQILCHHKSGSTGNTNRKLVSTIFTWITQPILSWKLHFVGNFFLFGKHLGPNIQYSCLFFNHFNYFLFGSILFTVLDYDCSFSHVLFKFFMFFIS